MFYITGDTHRDFKRVAAFCDTVNTTKDDTLIILGDAGINYFGAGKDREIKRLLRELPITLLCIHGNHERRPESTGLYQEISWHGGTVYAEPMFPNILFAKDGEVYELDGKRCIAIGGAYSVDKHYRLANGWHWWADEQPSTEIRERVEGRLESESWSVDIILSHTCPMKYIPREVFLSGIDQSGVDNATEEWLDGIEDRLSYKKWYCAHFHTNKVIDKMRFLFEDFVELR